MKSPKRIIAESTGLVLSITIAIVVISFIVNWMYQYNVTTTANGDIKSDLVIFGSVTLLVAIVLQFGISWYALVRYYKKLQKNQIVKKKYLILAACIASITPIVLLINFVIFIFGMLAGSY